MQTMYYIGLDFYKRTISYCVKDGLTPLDGIARFVRPCALVERADCLCRQCKGSSAQRVAENLAPIQRVSSKTRPATCAYFCRVIRKSL